MTQPTRSQTVAAETMKPADNPSDARRIAATLTEAMDGLLAIIERETELVRAGKITDALRLDRDKSDLSKQYVAAINSVKASQPYMTAATPDVLAALQRHHEVFRAMLQINLTVLATAHAVSEGIIRGVNSEIQRKNAPQTYTAYGNRAAPSPRQLTPIAVSRSL